jgi:uncharacterized membrane protein
MTGYRYLFYGLVVVAVSQVVYYYPQLPEVMASHFDGRGSPNDWSSREFFFGIYLAMVVLVIGIFRVLPNWSLTHSRFGLKIPHRDYWLAPARREQSHTFFRNHMLVMGVIHLLLAIITIELAIRRSFESRLKTPPPLNVAPLSTNVQFVKVAMARWTEAPPPLAP